MTPTVPSRLAGAIAIGGLIYIPICWFETLAGPRWYLSGLLYNINAYSGMVERLGGYRPEGFFSHGLELAEWMALSTIIVTWLWLSRSGWRPFGLPPWSLGLASAALGATTLACRGVFGYLALAIGLGATVATVAFRTRVLLMALSLVPPAYIVARSTGIWDGRTLAVMAARAHREGTINVRLESEDRFVAETMARDPLFGFGGRAPDWEADSWWVTAMKGGGVIGMVAQYLTFLLPALLVVFGPRRSFPPRSTEVGLALFILVLMIDSLLNTSMIATTSMIGGTLVASYLADRPRSRRPEDPGRQPSRPRENGRNWKPFPIPLIVTLILLTAIEILGRLPRSHRSGPASVSTPTPITYPDQPKP